jgi:uncharacterized protein DUF6088
MATGKQSSRAKRRGSVMSTVRRRVERGGDRYWRRDDFDDLPASAVAMALSRLTDEGVLRRERKGVYYRPRQTSFGLSQPTGSATAALSLRAPVHPAGLTAANVLGFTTQNPARLEYSTPAAGVPTSLSEATVRTRRPPGRRALSAEDGALLEFLRERAATSDLPREQTYTRLYSYMRDRDRFARLGRAALEEPPRVRAMLGALGTEVGADARVLSRLRASLNPLSRFDFGELRDLPHAAEWQAK